MTAPRTIVDLNRMRRHYIDFRAAWDRGADEPGPRQSPTLMTIAAVLAAEDLGVLLDFLEAGAREESVPRVPEPTPMALCEVCGQPTDTPPECGDCANRDEAQAKRRGDL